MRTTLKAVIQNKKKLMASLRTPKSTKLYTEYQLAVAKGCCSLCEKPPTQRFKYWKIIDNSFPYDQIARIHHMIAPLRHVVEHDLNREELVELKLIKRTFVNEQYDYVIETTDKN